MERTFSIRKFRLGILVYLSKNTVFRRKFPFGETNLIFHLHTIRNFRNFGANGKQPLSYLNEHRQVAACYFYLSRVLFA